MSRRLLLPALMVLLTLAGCTGDPEPTPQAPPLGVPAPQPPPGPGDRFVFAAKGDWGAGTPQQASLTAQMCETRKTTPFDVVVTAGDNFYKPDGNATEGNYYGPENCLISYPGHQWRATWGNHDVGGDSTRTVLGAERTYTYLAGPAQFFMLDSNRVSDSQTAWLEKELALSTAEVKIAVYHHPGLTVGLHENYSPVRRDWMPLFEEYGVDLVINGHNHAYEHSVLNGVDYVITGGGGSQIYPCVDDQPWLVSCIASNHFLLVELEGPVVSVKAIDPEGRVIDSFVRGCTPAGSPPRAACPPGS